MLTAYTCSQFGVGTFVLYAYSPTFGPVKIIARPPRVAEPQFVGVVGIVTHTALEVADGILIITLGREEIGATCHGL